MSFSLDIGRQPDRRWIGILLHLRILVVEFMHRFDDLPLANMVEQIV